MSVLSIPDYRGGNPYQENLGEALSEEVIYGQSGSNLPVFRAILSGRISVVHFHWVDAFLTGDSKLEAIKRFGLFTLWLFAIRISGVPVVWTIHNVRMHDANYPGLERRFKRWLVTSGTCDRFIVHCEAVTDRFIEELGLPQSVRKRTDVIPHGHYLDNYEQDISRERAREQLQIPQDETVFLFFGLIRPYKGVSDLISAFKTVSIPQSRLLIAGNPVSSEIANTLRNQSRSDDRIQCFLEFIPDDEIQLYMNAADIVVLPYRRITTSGTAILAMSFAKGIIVPELGCLPTLLDEEGAILYDTTEPDALETALRDVMERDMTAMGEYNERLVATYDWDHIAELTEETYEKAK